MLTPVVNVTRIGERPTAGKDYTKRNKAIKRFEETQHKGLQLDDMLDIVNEHLDDKPEIQELFTHYIDACFDAGNHLKVVSIVKNFYNLIEFNDKGTI